jgi:glycosyltransferase involved in cell wall biosynthesis
MITHLPNAARDCESSSSAAPIKVVRIITRLGIGGPAQHVVILNRELKARGYTSTLLAGVCAKEDGDMSYLLTEDDSVQWLPTMFRSISGLNDIRSIWRVYRILRRDRPDIVHTHTAKAGLIGRIAARLAGVPIVVHTFHGNVLNNYFPRVVSEVFRNVERFLAKFTNVICVVSPQQSQELSHLLGPQAARRLRVVRLGLDLDRELNTTLPNFSDEILSVGWLGRLVPVKDVPLLAAVAERLFTRTSRVRILVAGDGPDREVVQSMMTRFGPQRFQWMGWQRDIPSFLSQVHVLLQTSRNEGTPVSLIQGMAAGRPFVSTAVGGVVDLASGPESDISPTRRVFANCVLCVSDPACLADALIQLENSRHEIECMSHNARAFAAASFQKRSLVRNIDELYRELLNASPEVSNSTHPRF